MSYPDPFSNVPPYYPTLSIPDLLLASAEPLVYGTMAALGAEVIVEKLTEFAGRQFISRVNKEDTGDATVTYNQTRSIQKIAEESGRLCRNNVLILSGLISLAALTVLTIHTATHISYNGGNQPS